MGGDEDGETEVDAELVEVSVSRAGLRVHAEFDKLRTIPSSRI